MKTDKTAAPVPQIEVKLPSRILLPANADLNALMRVLSSGVEIDTVHSVEINGESEYCGYSTFYKKGPAIPEISPVSGMGDLLFDTKEEAKTRKREIVEAILESRRADNSANAA